MQTFFYIMPSCRVEKGEDAVHVCLNEAAGIEDAAVVMAIMYDNVTDASSEVMGVLNCQIINEAFIVTLCKFFLHSRIVHRSCLHRIGAIPILVIHKTSVFN